MPYLLALASAVFYGSADFIGGLVTRRLAAIPVVIVSQAAGLIAVLVLLPVFPSVTPTSHDVWWGAASGLAGGIGVALLYHALAIGTMSVVAPTTAVAAVIIPVVASVLLGERPGLLVVAGIVLGLLAIYLVSQQAVEQQQIPRSARNDNVSGIGPALGAGVAIGFFLLALAQTRSTAGLWPLVAARTVSVSLIGILGIARRESMRMPRGLLGLTIAGGLLDMIANALYMVAAQLGPLSPVVTLSSLYPATTVLLARGFLHERLSALQKVGVACALLAVVLIVS